MANKIIKKISPCSAYDIAGTEQWLEEMAAQGYHLIPERGFFLGIGRFEVGEPRRVKYRLEAASARMALFEVLHWNTDVKPDEEALDIYEKMGWEYVTNRLAFHVYRSTQEDAREFNTDPHMQAEGLKSAGIRLLILLFSVVQVALNNAAQIKLGGGMNFASLTTVLSFGGIGSVTALLFMIARIWIDIEILNRCIRFYIYWRKIKSGENVRTQQKKHRIHLFHRIILLGILWISCIVGIILSIGNQVGSEIGIQEHNGPIPFAVLNDAFPDGEKIENEWVSWDDYYSNKIRSWSDPLAPENYNWIESSHFLQSDGDEFSADYDVTYHRMKNQRLADLVVKEYMIAAERMDGYYELEIPQVDADYVLLYGGEMGGFHLIMQIGSQVVAAEVLYSGMGVNPDRIDTENLVIEMADALAANK